MGHDGPLDARRRPGRPPRRPPRRSGRGPGTTRPGPPSARPTPHLVVVAHDDDRQRGRPPAARLGHGRASAARSPGSRAPARRTLAARERLHRHDHRCGGRRCHRRGAYRGRGAAHRRHPIDGATAGYGPPMPIRVAVIGAGSWGTTVAALAAHNAPTVLWARRPELAAEIDRDHRNSDYLAGLRAARGARGHGVARGGGRRGRRAGHGRAVARHAGDAPGAGAPRAAVGARGQPGQGPGAGHPPAHDRRSSARSCPATRSAS